jgi:hypothetical protein
MTARCKQARAAQADRKLRNWTKHEDFPFTIENNMSQSNEKKYTMTFMYCFGPYLFALSSFPYGQMGEEWNRAHPAMNFKTNVISVFTNFAKRFVGRSPFDLQSIWRSSARQIVQKRTTLKQHKFEYREINSKATLKLWISTIRRYPRKEEIKKIKKLISNQLQCLKKNA